MDPDSSMSQNVDRFSDLPDAVIHHIFSYLGMNDTVRFSKLSRRCRQVCLSSPYLFFSTEMVDICRCKLYQKCARCRCRTYPKNDICTCRKFSSFLTKFLSLRVVNEIKSLRLYWTCRRSKHVEEGWSLVDSWIHLAVQFNVQELDLNLNFHKVDEAYVLSKFTPKSQFLRGLILPSHLPLGSLHFPSLEVLSLRSIQAIDGSLLEESLSRFSPTIKKLNFEFDYVSSIKSLSINSPYLESLSIKMRTSYDLSDICINAERLRNLSLNIPCCRSGFELNFCIPNLQTLKWSGEAVSFSTSESFVLLENAVIDLQPQDRYPGNYFNGKFYLQLLNNVSGARNLQLDISNIEALFLQGHPPISFWNLHALDINIGQMKDYHVPVIAYFIMGMPNLKTLTLKSHGESRDYQEFLDALNSKGTNLCKEHKDCQILQPVNQLKEVKIELSGKISELGLVKYLLSSAKSLERMTIFFSPSCYYTLASIGVEKFNTASSTFILLLPKEFEESIDLVERYERLSQARFDEARSDESSGSDCQFSNLPDPIFYYILSLLPLRAIIRVGLSCKEIRNRCFPSSRLNFDLYPYKDELFRSHYINFLDKISTLNLRNKKNIKSFCVRWFYSNPESSEELLVYDWLQRASKCNVQELKIDVMPEEGKAFELPPSIRGCQSLRVLDMDLHRHALKYSSKGLLNLKVLSLKSVQIVCKSFDKLISSCGLLKSLHLEDLCGVEKINITSNSLLSLTFLKKVNDLQHLKVSSKSLRSLTLSWFCGSATKKSFELCAPNLKVLKWRGDVVNYVDIGLFMSLEDASFDLRPPTVTVMDSSLINCLVGLFWSLKGVKSLELNFWHIEVLTQDHQLDVLNGLQNLVLNARNLKDYQVSAMISHLGLFPDLHTLQIKSYSQPWGTNLAKSMGLETSSYQSNGWESERCIYNLEVVEIELTGGDYELEVAKYLLKHAINLKKMVIFYSLLGTHSHRLLHISKELPNFKKASSEVTVFFLPYV